MVGVGGCQVSWWCLLWEGRGRGRAVLWDLFVFCHVDNQIHMFAVFLLLFFFVLFGRFSFLRDFLDGHVFPAPLDLH